MSLGQRGRVMLEVVTVVGGAFGRAITLSAFCTVIATTRIMRPAMPARRRLAKRSESSKPGQPHPQQCQLGA
jgi:hypothetical protein